MSKKTWAIVKSNNIKNKGINFWLYEPNETVFAGVEIETVQSDLFGLEHKSLRLKKYAYYKHIGPYHQIKTVTQNIQNEVRQRGYQTILPYLEIYGHWTSDENKAETELLLTLK